MENNVNIILAWKDSSYRATLSSTELSQVPAMPIEDALLELDTSKVMGGKDGVFFENPSHGFWCTLSSESGGCCNPFYTWSF